MSATWEIREGDCIEAMAAMDEASVDAVVCDPPYGLEFMGKDWDRPDRMGKVSDFGQADGTPFRRKAGTASWAASGNPVCRSCGGTKYDRARPNGCACDAPNFPNEAAKQMRVFQAWCEGWAREALRVLKPGGHLLAFGGTRTYHRLAAGVEDAGFEIRDCVVWLYGSGFPKSLDVSKAIDKAAGAERETGTPYIHPRDGVPYVGPEQPEGRGSSFASGVRSPMVTTPSTPEAHAWDGWGTALKPAHEPIVVARKPLAGTVAGNVLAHGTGALNIDGCRVGTSESWDGDDRPYSGSNGYGPDDADGWEGNWTKRSESHAAGRWPANVVLDEEAVRMLDEQSGVLTSGANPTRRGSDKFRTAYGAFAGQRDCDPARGAESGGASRFFYCAKASSAERGESNDHPTVKPVELMRWLLRLVTPPGGLALDPFAGSGTTGIAAMREGFSFIGLEREPEYVALARARIRQDAPLLNCHAEVAA